MEINYDKDSDALYIKLRQGEFALNKKINDFTILDLDKKGNVLGIEIIDASKHLSKESLAEIKVKNLAVAQ